MCLQFYPKRRPKVQFSMFIDADIAEPVPQLFAGGQDGIQKWFHDTSPSKLNYECQVGEAVYSI